MIKGQRKISFSVEAYERIVELAEEASLSPAKYILGELGISEKNKRKTINFQEEDYERISKLAKEANLSLANYVLSLLDGKVGNQDNRDDSISMETKAQVIKVANEECRTLEQQIQYWLKTYETSEIVVVSKETCKYIKLVSVAEEKSMTEFIDKVLVFYKNMLSFQLDYARRGGRGLSQDQLFIATVATMDGKTIKINQPPPKRKPITDWNEYCEESWDGRLDEGN